MVESFPADFLPYPFHKRTSPFPVVPWENEWSGAGEPSGLVEELGQRAPLKRNTLNVWFPFGLPDRVKMVQRKPLVMIQWFLAGYQHMIQTSVSVTIQGEDVGMTVPLKGSALCVLAAKL